MARGVGTIEPISAIINPLPTQKLNIYAFGTGNDAELGLGPEVNAKVGIVAIAIGGMHGLALSYEGNVYSWGVNDQYALGRATTHTPLTRVVSTDDEVPLNPLESTPMLIAGFPEGTVIASIAAGDSLYISVTDTGRCTGGPSPATSPKNIVRVSIGTDHVLGLTKEGDVYAWGNDQQSQLGRRVSERRRLTGLTPRQVSLPRRQVKYVATSSYHSFAITRDGSVWAWGLNQYGQCGIYDPQRTGEDSTVVPVPTIVPRLAGELLVWSRLDSGQLGIAPAALSADDCVLDAKGKPCCLRTPHAVPGIRFSTIGCGTDHNIAVSKEGQAYSWGFRGSYQTGLSPDAGDGIVAPTRI
ncbi:regulator of chromosome condensation 1/beta-lactamase-inhibitor protein II [Tuber brumale]|nr:regulator of chromosome condensation 1/beta-lactamase-inhibitor protein II [Tuber brumale]